MTMALDFYHGHGSPYSWRVWLALEAKQVPYELKLLSFAAGDTRKPEFVAINPRHQVPTLVDDGYAIWESTVVLEYLDERFPAGLKLFPGDVKSRGRIRRLAREAELYLGVEGIDPVTDEYFAKKDAPPDLARVEAAKTRIREELASFERELQGDFLAAAQPSAADFVLYPWIGYVKRITVRRPETRLTELVPERIAAWAKRIESLPYFDKTFPPHWR
jgi:glutathione S-transferase